MNYKGMGVEILELFVEASYRRGWPARVCLRWVDQRARTLRKKRHKKKVAAEVKLARVLHRAEMLQVMRLGGPAVTRDVCPRCGGPVERREGTSQVFHVGVRACPALPFARLVEAR